MNDQTYDPARLLTLSALIFVFLLLIFVSVIITIQINSKGEANTESWAALTGLIGWVTGTASGIYNNRFGSTQQSSKKDETIQKLTETAAQVASTTAQTQKENP